MADSAWRPRDPQARRPAILAAAREVFAERGYQRATVREIARRAGVTHGLITLHFGSKEKLFVQAVPGPRDLVGYVGGDRESLPERVAAGFVRTMETGDPAEPLLALIRSAASDESAARTLLSAIREQTRDAYRTVLGEDDLDVRVDLIGSFLIGVTFSRYVLREGPLAELDAEGLTARLTQVLRTIMT